MQAVLRNGGERMETIKLIGAVIVTASKIALYVMASIALAKYITA